MNKVRVWEVKFEVHQPLPSLPIPNVVVEEVQSLPKYRHDGRLRKEPGGQLSITIGGRGCFRLDDREIELTPGMAFLHNHADPRTGYFYPRDGQETWRFLWISFYSKSAEEMVADINARYGYVFHLPTDRGVAARMAGYRHYRGTVQVMTPLAGARLVMDILAGLGDTFEQQLIGNPRSIMVHKAQEHIAANLDSDIGISDVAAALGISREHLSRVFKEQTGMTAGEYIRQRKMNLALDLLLQTGLSCKEVASKTGFRDHSSFTRAFRGKFGAAPGRFRQSGCRSDI